VTLVRWDEFQGLALVYGTREANDMCHYPRSNTISFPLD
jgi:uncharacterized cupin superfamily protein